MLRLGVMVVLVVVLTPVVVAVVKMGVRVSAVAVVVFEVVSMVSVIMRRVSPIQLVFPSNLLKTLSGLFRR